MGYSLESTINTDSITKTFYIQTTSDQNYTSISIINFQNYVWLVGFYINEIHIILYILTWFRKYWYTVLCIELGMRSLCPWTVYGFHPCRGVRRLQYLTAYWKCFSDPNKNLLGRRFMFVGSMVMLSVGFHNVLITVICCFHKVVTTAICCFHNVVTTVICCFHNVVNTVICCFHNVVTTVICCFHNVVTTVICCYSCLTCFIGISIWDILILKSSWLNQAQAIEQ